MKKNIAIILTILSLLLILDSINFGHSLMMFFLAGVIPGTNIALDGTQMLELCAGISGFVLSRLTTRFIASILLRTSVTSETHPTTA